MGMTPFRFAIAVCCGLAASSVLYVSQKADGITLAESSAASIQEASPSVAAAPPRPSPAATGSHPLAATPSVAVTAQAPLASPSPAIKPPTAASLSAVPRATASLQASPSAPVKAAPSPALTVGPSASPPPAIKPPAAKTPSAASPAPTKSPPAAPAKGGPGKAAPAASKAAKHPTSKQAEPPAPKRIIIRHSQPGDVVFTMEGEELQVEFRQAPSPKRQGGRS
ncbi:hypothetical protein D3C86_1028740 [compost metagenome]